MKQQRRWRARASRIVQWKVVITYAVLALILSITAGLIYVFLTGGL